MKLRFLTLLIILCTGLTTCAQVFEGETPWKANAHLSQYTVLNQFSAQGSSPASCGYHALRNALCHIRSAQSDLRAKSPWRIHWMYGGKNCHLNKRMISHLHGFAFTTIMNSFKGVESFTRHADAQKLIESSTYYREGLSDIQTFTKFVEDKLISILKTICAKTLLEIHHDRYQYELTSEKVYQTYKELISTLRADRTNCTCPELLKELSTRSRFDEFFNRISSSITCTPHDGNILLNGTIANTIRPDSDWVDNQELIALIEQERSEGMLRDNPALIKTHGHSGDDDLSELNELKDLINRNKDFSAAIIIYSGGSRNRSSSLWSWIAGSTETSSTSHSQLHSASTNGHWFTLCIDSKDNFRTYTVMDSLNNHNRLNDPMVHHLISYLEGTQESTSESGSTKTILYAAAAAAAVGAAFYFGKPLLFPKPDNNKQP